MGVVKDKFWVTCIGDSNKEIFLSSYKPIKSGDGNHYRPMDVPLGNDTWVPNCINLIPDEDTVRIEIIESTEETGIWLICVDDFFGEEQHLFVGEKPIHVKNSKSKGFSDWKFPDKKGYTGLHYVKTRIKMIAGDGPISVTLKRRSNKRKNLI